MTQVFLGLGSNLNREKNIRAGLIALEKKFGSLTCSGVYESEPVGFRGSNFYNLVVSLQTDLNVAHLSEVIKKIEDDNGRVRTGPKYRPRSLDIDILTFGNFVGLEAGVELPRAEIIENAFVLLPLSEIAPNQLHPKINKTYSTLWSEYAQGSQILWPIDLRW